jgi:hypothetical protein
MLFAFIFFLGFSSQVLANGNISVVDVRRNITLSEDDPVYKDFYINAGPGTGLKKGLVVTAVRKINIRDASGASAVGEIMVPVGQLRIIAVYEKVAVAREFNLLSRDELPMLEQIGIMTGDQIDLKGAFIDNSKRKAKIHASTDSEASITTTVVTSGTNTPAAPSKESNPVETAKATQPKPPKIEETSATETKENKPGA